MDYFARLGGLVEQMWTARNRDEEALPEIAERAITDLPPREHLDPNAFVRAFLSPSQPATRQLVPVGVFGQPGITAYFGREFVIDLYFWTNALAAIHNHPFCGLFYIVRGHSVHSVYEFAPREQLGPRIAIGDVRLARVEVLREGDHRLFSLRDRPLIHTLLHVPVPSISMVIRTLRTVDYLRYLPPSLAVAMSEPDDFIARQLRLLDMLRVVGDPNYEVRLREFLAHADFETTFRAISAAHGAFAERGELDALLEMGRARHGDRMDVLPEVLARGARALRANALREQFGDADDRFAVSVLMSVETRAQALDAMRARYGESDDPVARLAAWVGESGMFADDEPAPRIVAKALIEGAALDEVFARLREEFPADLIERQRRVIEAFCEDSLFAVMRA